jgi:predicted metal-dependent HD superfamily phosphohydrolase
MNPFLAFQDTLKQYIGDKALVQLPYRWNEKHRYYHNTNHLVQILQDIENDFQFKSLNIYEKHALLLAAFYHDAVYNPKKEDNEDQSIKLFIASFKGKDIKMIDKVCDLIEVTKHRKRPFKKLEKIMWDADNSGFKKGYDHLMRTEKLIQKEYSYLPKEKFREGKIKFLESNLGLFNTKVDKDLQKLITYYRDKF